EALHRDTIENASRANASELVEQARSKWANLINEVEKGFVGIVAELITQSGIASCWQHAGITANQLARHLFDAASGIKASTDSLPAYREQMKIAIRIIGQGGRS